MCETIRILYIGSGDIVKKTTLLLLSFAFLIFLSTTVLADAVTVDKKDVERGYITVKYNEGFEKAVKIKVIVDNKSDGYWYDLKTNNPVTIPLQMGNGNYCVYVLRHLVDNSYSVIYKENFDVAVKSANDMFVISNPYIDFNQGMEFYRAYSSEHAAIADITQKIQKYYDQVVRDYVYDYEKLKNIPSGYVPVIDKTFAAKKGICSDYSTLLAGYLRACGVPVKLVMGYAPEIKEYHAWNEIFIGGKWVVVDATYDSAYVHAGYSYTMAKDGAKFQVIKTY